MINQSLSEFSCLGTNKPFHQSGGTNYLMIFDGWWTSNQQSQTNNQPTADQQPTNNMLFKNQLTICCSTNQPNNSNMLFQKLTNQPMNNEPTTISWSSKPHARFPSSNITSRQGQFRWFLGNQHLWHGGQACIFCVSPNLAFRNIPKGITYIVVYFKTRSCGFVSKSNITWTT